MNRSSNAALTRLTGTAILLGTFALGALVGAVVAQDSPQPAVTGIGGIFFKSDDPAATRAWYREHLGIAGQGGSVNFVWRENEQPEVTGFTVWSPFARNSDYFGAAGQDFMINYRVRDLRALLAQLEASGIQQVKPLEEYPYGRFAWIDDGDGRRIELWEPIEDD
jgi:predicted enzyme related to lactoylglutathione lyase